MMFTALKMGSSLRVLPLAFLFISFLASPSAVRAADPLEPGVRGLATRAPKNMKIDGDLSEFKDAFCTPVEYFNNNLKNRAAQFFFMWDDDAFYAALRTLDTKPANLAPDDRLWEGDAVEMAARSTPGAMKISAARNGGPARCIAIGRA